MDARKTVPRASSGPSSRISPTRSQDGSTLVEAMITLFLLAMTLLAIAQMIGYGLSVHRIAGEVTSAAALAEHKLEELRNTDYAALAPGGSLAADVAGYFDTQDVDGDGNPDFTRRWRIVDNGDGKVLTLRVVSTAAFIGTAKQATLATLVAAP